MDEFKDRLKIAMGKQHINSNQLANKAEISRTQIFRYLKGDYKAKQDVVYKLALALDVSPAWLMGIDENDLLLDKREQIKMRIDTLDDTQLNQLEKVMDAMFDSN